ncbi:hypothetical protein [Bosea caraganae]|uniref:hypothetical protein n=1 Tax=Bosea caraganae TaxID=2763117 RepID=UPI0011C058F1|nr:hypothetical protein [Bosea caraganae]
MSDAVDRWRRVRFLETPKFANEINSELFETVRVTVVFGREIFYTSNFNVLTVERTIEWE